MARPTLKADFHVHTDHSKDSRTSPKEVVKRAIDLGLDVIAVTDHNTVKGSLEAEKYAKGKPLLVIPGQEVHCKEGEIIVLSIRETLPNKMPARELMKMAHKKGGFVIVPHPFDLLRKGAGKSLPEFLDLIDAIEVFNARTIFDSFNRKALSFAHDHNIPATVGSDSHFPEEMGKAIVVVHAEPNEKDIYNALRSGKTELVMSKQGLPAGIKRGLYKIRTYF